MTPHEIAMKFASASSSCKNGKCPFTADCRGTTDTCKMKEVAMVIRGLVAENETLRAQYNALDAIAKQVVPYVRELERINEHYYRTIESFQRGYRPKVKRKRLKPGRKPKEKTDPIEMDGDERYAYKEPKVKTELPVVII